VLAKVMNYYMIKYNVEMCCYDKILVNVAAYVIYTTYLCIYLYIINNVQGYS